jgi:hypothetical protein
MAASSRAIRDEASSGGFGRAIETRRAALQPVAKLEQLHEPDTHNREVISIDYRLY